VRVRALDKDPQPVPAETFERLLTKAADPQMGAYLLCGWRAGLRLNEALALEWEPAEKAPYLDLARDRIILPAEFVKAVKDQWVPLDPELRKVLEALPRHGRKVFRFVDRKGRPLTDSGVSQRVIKLAKKARVKLTRKALRRGFGCRYAGKVPAQVLQKLMRHANIKTTMAITPTWTTPPWSPSWGTNVTVCVTGRSRRPVRAAPASTQTLAPTCLVLLCQLGRDTFPDGHELMPQ
jgi:integrase